MRFRDALRKSKRIIVTPQQGYKIQKELIKRGYRNSRRKIIRPHNTHTHVYSIDINYYNRSYSFSNTHKNREEWLGYVAFNELTFHD